MENKAEDEIRKRWEREAKEKAETEDRMVERPRKRLRELEYSSAGILNGFGVGLHPASEEESAVISRPKSKKASGKATQAARRGTTRTRGKIMELTEEDSNFVELD